MTLVKVNVKDTPFSNSNTILSIQFYLWKRNTDLKLFYEKYIKYIFNLHFQKFILFLIDLVQIQSTLFNLFDLNTDLKLLNNYLK